MSKPSIPLLIIAVASGGLLAYGQDNPTQPSSSQPASQSTSQPTSVPSFSSTFPLGDLTMQPTSRTVINAPIISDEEILGTVEVVDDAWRLEEMRFRFSVFGQRGRGFQSVADLPTDPVTGDVVKGPGKEDALIFQPIVLFGLRQNEKVYHEITIPVDIVSGASVDALDAISTASRVNEAGAIDVATTYQIDKQSVADFRYGVHIEEPLRSWFLGTGLTRSLADDNATLGVNLNATFDLFDFVTTRGGFRGLRHKVSLNSNLSFSQILSPTTLFDTSYGITYQNGTLQTTYNSLDLSGTEERGEELFPTERVRQAISMRISQHIPQTLSTIKASYRYYFEDENFGLTAHTAELQGFQYLSRWLYARGSYRYYTQSGVNFFATEFPAGLAEDTSRTSDSDLAPFSANEYGLKLVVLGEKAPLSFLKKATFDVSYTFYKRASDLGTSDLSMQLISLGYGRSF
jgi:Protein of unknown function (DUF3570)